MVQQRLAVNRLVQRPDQRETPRVSFRRWASASGRLPVGLFIAALVALRLASTGRNLIAATAPPQRIINLVCVGDSITAGATLRNSEKENAAVKCQVALSGLLPRGSVVYLSNNGHGGATTKDFLPPKSVEDQTRGLIAAHPDGELVFSVMLGTNDSANRGPNGSPISAADYGKNLKAILDELVQTFPQCRIVIHHPTYYSRNTHNSSDYEGESAANRLKSYFPVIDSMVAMDHKDVTPHLSLGDTEAYGQFERNYRSECTPEQGQHGVFYLHPNAKGAERLGRDWAAALAKVLK